MMKKLNVDAIREGTRYIQKGDPYRYKLIPTLPISWRPVYITCHGFQLFLEEQLSPTSSSDIPLLKASFYKEQIIGKKQGAHGLLDGVNYYAEKGIIQPAWLLRILHGYRKQLEQPTYTSLADQTQFYDETIGSVYYALIDGLKVTNAATDHYVSHMSRAYGLIRYVQTIDPAMDLTNHAIQLEGVKDTSALVYEMAVEAHNHMGHAKKIEDLPSEVTPLLRLSLFIDAYLTALEKVDFDISHPSLQKCYQSLGFLWKYYSHVFFNK